MFADETQCEPRLLRLALPEDVPAHSGPVRRASSPCRQWADLARPTHVCASELVEHIRPSPTRTVRHGAGRDTEESCAGGDASSTVASGGRVARPIDMSGIGIVDEVVVGDRITFHK